MIWIALLTLQIGNPGNWLIMSCLGQGGLCPLSALVKVKICDCGTDAYIYIHELLFGSVSVCISAYHQHKQNLKTQLYPLIMYDYIKKTYYMTKT